MNNPEFSQVVDKLNKLFSNSIVLDDNNSYGGAFFGEEGADNLGVAFYRKGSGFLGFGKPKLGSPVTSIKLTVEFYENAIKNIYMIYIENPEKSPYINTNSSANFTDETSPPGLSEEQINKAISVANRLLDQNPQLFN